MFCNKSVSADATECSSCGAALVERDAPRCAVGPSPGTVGDVRSMLEQGRQVDAVRMYREQTGTGLREATAAIEALGRIQKGPAARTYASRASRDANLNADLWALVQNGQKSEAIRLYRERTGETASRAEDAVEVLAREHGVLPGKAGCFGLVVLCLAVPALFACLTALVTCPAR